MPDGDQVGVVTITSGTRSLVRGKTKAEDSLGLVLLQHGSFFDDRTSNTRGEIFITSLLCYHFCGGHCVVSIRN